MFEIIMGVLITVLGVQHITEIEEREKGAINYWHPVAKQQMVYERNLVVEPFSEQKYRNVVRQAYDYTCGSAALTTVLNHYLGRRLEERQVMEGLIRFGETDKIVERRAFSLLDMKRLTTALGHPAGGFKASMDDVRTLDHPAIVQIEFGGFKHFVVIKGYRDGHVFVADPALGNISFTEERFKDVWGDYRENENGVLFIVFPNGFEPVEEISVAESDLRYIDERYLDYMVHPPFQFFNERIEREADEAASIARLIVNANSFDITLSGGTSDINISDYVTYIEQNGRFEMIPAGLNPSYDTDTDGNLLPISRDGQVYRLPDGREVRGIIDIHKRTYLKN